MEATIIRLDNVNSTAPMVVRSATFEEAFGDYSEARGRGRARRTKRKVERQEAKAERKIARQTRKDKVKEAKQTRRSNRKERRQEMRIDRRAKRKGARQEIRASQQEARMGRRTRRMDMRQQRAEARNLRDMTREQGDQERDTYALEQELYRDSLMPQEEQGGGGFTDDQQGGGGFTDDQQGGGGFTENVEITEDWASAPQGFYDESDEDLQDGGYGDNEAYDSPYIQEENEFADESYFNLEGMDGKGVVLPSAVSDDVQKLMNNERAYRDLSEKRNEMSRFGDNTKGIDMRMQQCYGRICELREKIDNFVNADGNPNERRRRRSALASKMGLKRRKRVRGQFGGSEVPVEQDLNPEFSNQRIVIPPSSGFDAYSDLGRPVIVNGVTQSDYSDYSSDLLTDSAEPTTIDLFSNADGKSGTTGKTILSIAVGIGVGALAIYLAKRKGWI